MIKIFRRSYKKESDLEYILQVDVEYPENLHDFHNDSTFLNERMKIQKVEKLVANLHDKEKYVIHIRNLNQY